jgi:hypothetical protein
MLNATTRRSTGRLIEFFETPLGDDGTYPDEP